MTSTLMELLVYPAIFFLWRSRSLKPVAAEKTGEPAGPVSI
jgi:Cu(I)/Ag(I) efflux system membrane protein CusA/SilA